MKYVQRALLILLAVPLAACVNFGAVKGFSDETAKLTSATRDEFMFVAKDCADVARVRRIVEGVNTQGSNCEKLAGAVGELTSHTNDVLAVYGKKLGALADAKQFDYNADLQRTKAAFTGLKDREGVAALDPAVVNAGIAVADLLLKLATETQRKEAVEQLLAEKQRIQLLATYMKTFFAGGRTEARPIYQLQLQEDDSGLEDAVSSLKALSSREPIRTREWLDDIQARREALKKRVDGSVGSQLGSAIDAWLHSLDTLSRKAFEPDWKEWKDQYEQLKSKVTAATDAVDAARR